MHSVYIAQNGSERFRAIYDFRTIPDYSELFGAISGFWLYIAQNGSERFRAIFRLCFIYGSERLRAIPSGI